MAYLLEAVLGNTSIEAVNIRAVRAYKHTKDCRDVESTEVAKQPAYCRYMHHDHHPSPRRSRAGPLGELEAQQTATPFISEGSPTGVTAGTGGTMPRGACGATWKSGGRGSEQGR